MIHEGSDFSEGECPECGERVNCYDNWSDGNTEFEYFYECGECGHRWRMVVTLDATEPDTIEHLDYEPMDD